MSLVVILEGIMENTNATANATIKAAVGCLESGISHLRNKIDTPLST